MKRTVFFHVGGGPAFSVDVDLEGVVMEVCDRVGVDSVDELKFEELREEVEYEVLNECERELEVLGIEVRDMSDVVTDVFRVVGRDYRKEEKENEESE